MNKSFLATTALVATFAIALASTSTAQQIFIQDDFSGAAGLNAPGWSVLVGPTNSGNFTAKWRWDDPNPRGAAAPIATPFAIVDSDFAGGGSTTDSILQSAVFDVSTVMTSVNLEWDEYFRDLNSTIDVDVFDGSVWQGVRNLIAPGNIGNANPVAAPAAHAQFDVTALLAGTSNGRVRFRYRAGFDWYWAVDNINLNEPAAIDVAMISHDTPVIAADSCEAASATATVTVSIQNQGGALVAMGTLLQMTLTVDGAVQAPEFFVLPADLLVNATTQYIFTVTPDLSAPGSHTLIANVVLPGDLLPANDTLSRTFTAPVNSPISTPYSESFDSLTGTGQTNVPVGWNNDATDPAGSGGTFDWQSDDNGSTGSFQASPLTDHTLGTTGVGGTFMYVEDSTETAERWLFTPCLSTSGAGMPMASFWLGGVQPAGSVDDNILFVDVVDGNGVVLALAAGTYVGYGDFLWHQETIDLTPFAPAVVKLRFRQDTLNGNFNDDNGLDDFTFFDAAATADGQIARAGLALFNVNGSATNPLGAGVTDLAPGPFVAKVTQGAPITFDWEGPVSSPLTIFHGALGAVLPVASFPLLGGGGNIDVGGTPDPMTGIPSGLGVFIDGIGWFMGGGSAGFGVIDAYGFTDLAGGGGITLGLPAFGLPPGFVLTTMQFSVQLPAAPFFAISNAVSLEIQ